MTSIANSPVEALEQQRLAAAQRDGFSLFCINADGDTPGFVYTVGMAQYELPEILAFYPEGEGPATAGVVGALSQRLISGLQRFDRISLLRAATTRPFSAGDFQLSCELLRGDDFRHALESFTTRATRFRETLGIPRGVMVLNREDVPSFRQIRAQRMLAVS